MVFRIYRRLGNAAVSVLAAAALGMVAAITAAGLPALAGAVTAKLLADRPCCGRATRRPHLGQLGRSEGSVTGLQRRPTCPILS